MDYKTLKNLITIEGTLLFIQFWLGMSVNLFIQIPAGTPLNFFGYFGGVETLAHIANGFLILIIASILLVYSIKQTNSIFSRLSIIAIVFIVIAVVIGLVFILGGLDNLFSMAMAMSFITVYTLYFYEFYLIGRAETHGTS